MYGSCNPKKSGECTYDSKQCVKTQVNTNYYSQSMSIDATFAGHIGKGPCGNVTYTQMINITCAVKLFHFELWKCKPSIKIANFTLTWPQFYFISAVCLLIWVHVCAFIGLL